MNKLKIPQQIDKADKIFWSVSLKQLIILSVGGMLAYMIYVTFAPTTPAILHLPPVIIIITLTIAFAFIEIEKISFFKAILILIERLLNPTKRVFSGTPPKRKLMDF